MTKPLTHNRVDIKAILADPLLQEELIEGATNFICKVEGIRRKKDLEMTELSPQAQAVLDAADAVLEQADAPTWLVARGMAAALEAAADQVASRIPDDCTADVFNRQLKIRDELLAIAAELEGGND